ncbi:hypothetical protein Tco_1501837 [Tanacetum coccineum]
MSRPTGLKRLKKVGMSRRVESFEDQESLGAPEDASKQGRSIADLDKDDDVTLIDETQERQDDELITAGEAVTTASVEGSAAATTIEEITLARTLIQIKATKPKVVTTAATATTTTRSKARGVVVYESKVPLKRKDQIALDEQIARDIQAKLDVELIEEQKLARKQEEEANIALIESWKNTQAMMEADRLLAERLQSKEREELTDEEKGKQYMELIEKRRKHFAALRAQEKRNRPPTKEQKRTQMSTYLKNMGGYTYKQLKGKSFDEIQKLFDKEMKRVNTFVAMGSEVQESKEKNVEGSEETTKSSRKKMLGRKRAIVRILKETKNGGRQRLSVDKSSWKLKRYFFNDKDATRNRQRRLGGSLEDSQDKVHMDTNMLNKKLQTDHQNEMCYQLLKLMIFLNRVRWQVQLGRVGPDRVVVIVPAWSDFVRRNVDQVVRLLHFVEEGHDTFCVATYNKYGLENHAYKETSLMFWRCLLRVTKRSPRFQNLPLQLEKRVYPPSGSQTVDLVLNHRKYKVLVGNVPLENFQNILEMYLYGDEWWNMIEELDFQPGHFFAFTLLRRGLFHLTIFNKSGEAFTASETYSSYVVQCPTNGVVLQLEGAYIHDREDKVFYKKLTEETLKKGLIARVIPSDIVKTYKLYGYASAIGKNRDAQYEFKLRWDKVSNSLEIYSSPILRKMKEMTGFMANQWARFYLTEGTSLKDGVIRLDVC